MPLLIIDGDNLAHRAYHTTPKTVTGTAGQVINAIVGFFSMLMREIQDEKPRAVFVAWDTLGVDTYRSKLWPAYQGGRIFESEIRQQLELFPDICRAFGFGVGKQAGYEADDIIASVVKKEVAAGGSCVILTSDKDSYQLVSEKVTVISSYRGVKTRITPHEVVGTFGVLPEQVPEFKALSGDSSDKIPGAKGIGPKTAASLILARGSLDEVLANWKNPAEADLVRMFLDVVTMRDDANVELPENAPDFQSGADALEALGAVNLAARVRSS
ncbi:hypothetical protein BH11ARM1_BH11ARM1_04250 [soil metagenome]